MAKRAMATWKIVAMVLLVVLPGGSLVLLAIAGYRAYKRRMARVGQPSRPRRWPLWAGFNVAQGRA